MESKLIDLQLENGDGSTPELIDPFSRIAYFLVMRNLEPHELVVQIIMVLCAFETMVGHIKEDGFDPAAYNPGDFFVEKPGNGSTTRLDFPVQLDDVWNLMLDYLKIRLRTGKWYGTEYSPYQDYPALYWHNFHHLSEYKNSVESMQALNSDAVNDTEMTDDIESEHKTRETHQEQKRSRQPNPSPGTTGFQVLTDAEGSPLPELYEFIYETARQIVKALPAPPSWTSVIVYLLAAMESLNPHHAMDSALDDLCRLITQRLNKGKW